MTTLRTPIGPAVDAIQRIPVACWLGQGDDPNGYPNYPVYVNDQNVAQDTLDDATHALWDGAFGGTTARLIEAISADPSLVPADASTLDRAALLALYPAALTDPEAP